MSTELEKRLIQIKNVKDTKIIPENIKEGVTIFNVEGALQEGVIDQQEYDAMLLESEYLLDNGANYDKLKYIRSSGTQYIDTGYKPNSSTKIIMSFKKTSTKIAYERLYGAFDGNYCYNHIMRSSASGDTFAYNVNNSDRTSITFYNDQDNTIEATNNYVKVNDTTYSFNAVSYTSTGNLTIFFGKDTYGAYDLYSFKIYEGNDIKRDFIPVKRKSDDEVCLYDRVTGEFFTNQGTGSFVAGTN